MNVYQKFKGFGNIVLDLDACAFSLEHERAVHCILCSWAPSSGFATSLWHQKETLKRIVRPQQKFPPYSKLPHAHDQNGSGIRGDRVFKSQH